MKIAWVVLLLVGCGMANGKPTSAGELDSIDLAPSPGWPEAVATRSGARWDGSRSREQRGSPNTTPLTHTEPSMTHNDGFWGVAQVGR